MQRSRVWMVAVCTAGLHFAVGLNESAYAVWELGKPIVNYYGLNTAYPGSTAEQTLQYDKDGGYNLIWASHDETLHVAAEKGLRTLIIDPAYWQYQLGDITRPAKKAYIDSEVARLNSTKIVNGNTVPVYPAFYGYYLGDEYPASNFPAMGELVNYLRTKDPNHATYANISGLGAHVSTQQQVNDYKDYLNQFLTVVRPSFFSYDYYQFMNEFQGDQYVGPADLNGYLLNLGIVSTASRQAGIPFMNVVQAVRWNEGWRTPNANELRFLTYSTLAYGAEGISYFNWYSNYTAPGPGEPFYNGDTSIGGLEPESWNPLTPTDVYTALTPINHEFVEIAEELQPLEHIGSFMKGYVTSPLNGYRGPPGTSTLPNNSAFTLTGINDTLQYTNYDPVKGVLLGLFGPAGAGTSDATFTLVQNLDYTQSKSYTVHGTGNLSIFNATTGTWTATNNNFVDLTLVPGGGILVGLTSEIGVIPPQGIAVDINLAGTSGSNTESGFIPLEVAFGGTSNPSMTVDGITVTLNGEWAARDRVQPANNGEFTENLLLRDTAFPNTTTQNPATVTVIGLKADTTFDVSVWSYESGPYQWDLLANGELVAEDFVQGAAAPVTNDDYRLDFQATSNSLGEIVLSFSNITPAPNPYPEYRLNALRLIEVLTAIENQGDYNGNGIVDAGDYVVWRDSFGQNVAKGSGADGNGDGAIDQADYAYWKERFGNVINSGSASNETAVPEPSFFPTLWILFAMIGCVRGTRRHIAT